MLPDRLGDLFLKHAQHLRLRLHAHVADLVEKNRPGVRRLESPLAIGDRAGKGAFHVAEQLALDQLLGNRRAVHFDERLIAPAAQGVHGARDELLARSVLTEDQHAAVGRRRHRDLLAQLPHDEALAHHLAGAIDARAQRAVLGFEVPLPQRVADDEHRLLERQRLFDEVERADLDGLHRRLDVAVARRS